MLVLGGQEVPFAVKGDLTALTRSGSGRSIPPMDITEPLVLSKGSHRSGSGRGCAMNVIAWELGGEITDYPKGINRDLAKMVQVANDFIAQPTTRYPGTRPGRVVRWYKVPKEPVIPFPYPEGLTPTACLYPSLDYAVEEVFEPFEEYDERTIAWSARVNEWRASFEVPAPYAARLLDIAHETLDTDVPPSDPRDSSMYEAWEYYNKNIAGTLDPEVVLDILEESVQMFRRGLGLPEKRPTAPSVDAINDALRKMAVKV